MKPVTLDNLQRGIINPREAIRDSSFVIPEMPTAQRWFLGNLTIIRSYDGPLEMFGRMFNKVCHVSISHRSRYPTWGEIKELRYEFMPREFDAYMIFPPPSQYVNEHPNCFHLWMVLEKQT